MISLSIECVERYLHLLIKCHYLCLFLSCVIGWPSRDIIVQSTLQWLKQNQYLTRNKYYMKASYKCIEGVSIFWDASEGPFEQIMVVLSKRMFRLHAFEWLLYCHVGQVIATLRIWIGSYEPFYVLQWYDLFAVSRASTSILNINYL